MKYKLLFAVAIVLLVVGAIASVKMLQIRTLVANAKSFAEPPETVSTTVARTDNWQWTLTAIGSITPVQGVTITPEISGIVREIAFAAGAAVKTGDLLLRLDTSSEEAQLRAVEAQVELARLNIARVRNLRADKTVSQSELDTAEATLKEAAANADAIRSTIEKKTIRAPFSGHLGIRLVQLGQYLETGRPIVSLQSLTPVYVEFALPQQELARLKPGLTVRVQTDAYTDRVFEGKLTVINPDLDQSTRSVGLQATLENAGELLRPGMFARVEVLLPEAQNVLVIPATAVLSEPFGDSVYIVDAKPGKTNLVVRQQFIRTARTRGDFISVETGLKAGERIVSAGVFKLRNGMTVLENNDLVPKAEAAPKPADS